MNNTFMSQVPNQIKNREYQIVDLSMFRLHILIKIRFNEENGEINFELARCCILLRKINNQKFVMGFPLTVNCP